MTPPRMHADEVKTDVELVRHLVRSQHPRWADLPISRVASAGTDNAIYRLGVDLAVRLPRIHWAVELVAKEQAWLPALGPQLPLQVPRPVAAGEPDEAFPYPWGVMQWLPGEMANLDQLHDPAEAAVQLASFVRALRAIDPANGPQHHRGRAVRLGDETMQEGLERLAGDSDVDAGAVREAWARAVAAPDHDGPPSWFHGDLAYLNLLARRGELSAVIDWGTCGVGDPAIDTIVAWNLFPPGARQVYREALGVGDAEWERGKGWVLTGIFGVLSYRMTNPVLAADKIRGINAVSAEST